MRTCFEHLVQVETECFKTRFRSGFFFIRAQIFLSGSVLDLELNFFYCSMIVDSYMCVSLRLIMGIRFGSHSYCSILVFECRTAYFVCVMY